MSKYKQTAANMVVSEQDFKNDAAASWQRIKEDLPGYLDMMGSRGHFMIVMQHTTPEGETLGQVMMHGDILKIGDSLFAACHKYPELGFIVKAMGKKL